MSDYDDRADRRHPDLQRAAAAAVKAPRTYSAGQVTLPSDVFDDLKDAALAAEAATLNVVDVTIALQRVAAQLPETSQNISDVRTIEAALAATSREDGYTVDESADIVYDKVRDPATGKWKPHMVKGTDAVATSREGEG